MYLAAAIFFALALVCSGQSASITATLAGQIVSEGFIQWNVSVSSVYGFVKPLLIDHRIACLTSLDNETPRPYSIDDSRCRGRKERNFQHAGYLTSHSEHRITLRHVPLDMVDIVKVGDASQTTTANRLYQRRQCSRDESR